MTRVLILGSGIAGCSAALAAAENGAEVVLATKATRPAETTTHWAQGGIAVSRGDPDAFAADVLDAGDGRCDPHAVETLVENADDAVEAVLVERLGVPFADDYGREAAHSADRIRHVGAETGRHILAPFLAHLDDHPRVTVHADTAALELLTDEGRVRGALLDGPDGSKTAELADATVLATGGVGACFPRSTNPDTATGDGLAMAARAGADLADLAYVQFHPTATVGDDPVLVSEAVRGAGAVLRNADGERFMPAVHEDAELAPRDVVARAVADERERTGGVVLDTTPVDFASAFPALRERVSDAGHDPDSIPVAPAEHFLCGGVAVNDRGRTSLDRLYAVGEVSRTGVHGANRLASTSLLEGLVWGRRAGRDAATRERVTGDPEIPSHPERDPALPDGFVDGKFERLRRVLGEHVGLRRDPDGLGRACAALRRLKGETDAYARTRPSREVAELRNAATAGLLLARAAREAEPAGCHALEGVPCR
ncbi:L-aspartate oxidase [Halarchaeum nitratireducens]|uniref:L-aspartate oxidase n=1 Tax=Halarchaeum nitratireducens TaxID=489913 RepID=A0A830G6P3_9EURY|nr:FAD-dependent oxidoreductase [Halarchaeum nitratireducens]GGN07319.1 aspartate oxidase [Halarchaeum nitratireducens]